MENSLSPSSPAFPGVFVEAFRLKESAQASTELPALPRQMGTAPGQFGSGFVTTVPTKRFPAPKEALQQENPIPALLPKALGSWHIPVPKAAHGVPSKGEKEPLLTPEQEMP